MDSKQELMSLGFGAAVLLACRKMYSDEQKIYNLLKEAPLLPIDEKLIERLESDQKLPYVFIRGKVEPIYRPLYSCESSSASGVLKRKTITETRMARNWLWFWEEQKKIIHTTSDEVPFRIVNGQHGVEIVGGLSANLFDIDIVYTDYISSSSSMYERAISGVHQIGVQTTEQLLRDDSMVTAVGELKVLNGRLWLQPPVNGAPMYLTTATKSSLLHHVDQSQSSTAMVACCGGFWALAYMGWITYKFFMRLIHKIKPRRRENSTNFPQGERAGCCVVCFEHPNDIMCVPCLHVCLCVNCATRINQRCPVCRAVIEKKQKVFNS